MKRTYEDEKREALASYLSNKPDLKLMKIKTDLQLIGKLSIKRFRLKSDAIVRKICRGNS